VTSLLIARAVDVVYGPVLSRRLGWSLGVNPLGARKRCTLDCLYCQCGPTRPPPAQALFPSVEEIVLALEARLGRLRRERATEG